MSEEILNKLLRRKLKHARVNSLEAVGGSPRLRMYSSDYRFGENSNINEVECIKRIDCIEV